MTEQHVVGAILPEAKFARPKDVLNSTDEATTLENHAVLKPNFTGTWNFNHERSTLQIPAPEATIFVIDHREPTFRITRTHTVGERRDTFSLDLTTDGQLTSTLHEGLRLRSRAYWDDNTLVFDTGFVRAGIAATNIVRYTLSDGGNTLVAEECFRSVPVNYDNVWLLERVDPDQANY